MEEISARDPVRAHGPGRAQAADDPDRDRDRARRRDWSAARTSSPTRSRAPSTAIFTQIYRGTDATITGKSAFDLTDHGNTMRRPFDESLLAKVRERCRTSPGGVGGVGGTANLIGKNGKVIVFGGAPNLGFSVDPTQPRFNSLDARRGRLAEAERGRDRQVDRRQEGHHGRRQDRRRRRTGRRSACGSPGSSSSARAASIGGATLAGFDLPTAQVLFQQGGQARPDPRRKAKSGVIAGAARREIRAILPPRTQVRTRRRAGRRRTRRTRRLPQLPPDVPARVRRHRALRRRVRDRQLALDHDRPADARVRDAADARRVAPAGALLGVRRGVRDGRPRLDRRPLPRARAGEAASSALRRGRLHAAEQRARSSRRGRSSSRCSSGSLVTMLASLRPASRATRVPPIAAVREGATLPPGASPRTAGSAGDAGRARLPRCSPTGCGERAGPAPC